jgi:hypothetical protein
MPCPLCKAEFATLAYGKRGCFGEQRSYWQCARCALIFLDPACHPTPAVERATYLQHENSPAHVGYVDFLSQLAGPLAEALPDGAAGLDFGCGPGPTLSHLMRERGLTMENYDPLFRDQPALLSKQYDFVTCTEVLEHFYAPRVSLQLLDRLFTQTIGIMTLCVPVETPFAQWWYHRDPTHVCFYSQQTFVWIARWLGWTPLRLTQRVQIFTRHRTA